MKAGSVNTQKKGLNSNAKSNRIVFEVSIYVDFLTVFFCEALDDTNKHRDSFEFSEICEIESIANIENVFVADVNSKRYHRRSAYFFFDFGYERE